MLLRIAVILDSVVCHGHGQLADRERTGAKNITLDRNTVLLASCLTLFIPSWIRLAVIREKIVMVMASCLTVSVPRRT